MCLEGVPRGRLLGRKSSHPFVPWQHSLAGARGHREGGRKRQQAPKEQLKRAMSCLYYGGAPKEQLKRAQIGRERGARSPHACCPAVVDDGRGVRNMSKVQVHCWLLLQHIEHGAWGMGHFGFRDFQQSF